MEKIDDTFIEYASEILADTTTGLSGAQIVKYCNKYAIEFNIVIPIGTTDFGKFGSKVPNKRTALYKNLLEFNAIQQFHIIKELCELPMFDKNAQVIDLKKKLFIRYNALVKCSEETSEVLTNSSNTKSEFVDDKKSFIENYINQLILVVNKLKAVDEFDHMSVEDQLFDLIMEVRNIFSRELPEINEAILLRSGTGIRDANSVIGILQLYLINSVGNAQKIEKEKAMGRLNLNNKVFIVHGHDNEAKLEVARFIDKIGLEAVILHEQPNNGKTIIEKIESFTDVDFAVVLYTYCDEGKDKDKDELNKRARQNVIFEHGYLISKLGRDRVCALVKGEIETPGDVSGVVYVSMDAGEGWKLSLAKDMRAAGCNINMDRLLAI